MPPGTRDMDAAKLCRDSGGIALYRLRFHWLIFRAVHSCHQMPPPIISARNATMRTHTKTPGQSTRLSRIPRGAAPRETATRPKGAVTEYPNTWANRNALEMPRRTGKRPTADPAKRATAAAAVRKGVRCVPLPVRESSTPYGPPSALLRAEACGAWGGTPRSCSAGRLGWWLIGPTVREIRVAENRNQDRSQQQGYDRCRQSVQRGHR